MRIHLVKSAHLNMNLLGQYHNLAVFAHQTACSSSNILIILMSKVTSSIKLTISPPAGAGAGEGMCAGAAAAVLRGGQLQPLHGRHLRHPAGDRLHHHPRHQVRQGELMYFRWMDGGHGGVVNMALYSTLHEASDIPLKKLNWRICLKHRQ